MTKVNIPHEFKCDTEMIAEIEVFSHVDDVELVVFVSPTECVQNLDFDQSLVVKSVGDNDPNQFVLFVIILHYNYFSFKLPNKSYFHKSIKEKNQYMYIKKNMIIV